MSWDIIKYIRYSRIKIEYCVLLGDIVVTSVHVLFN